jgi:Glycosyltransferases involved in cell wall biogenesis
MSIYKAPAVSVITPIYNGEELLADSIRSIQRQTLQDFEIIAVDDGSDDRTAALVAEFQRADARIRLVRHTSNAGYPHACNTGFAHARGNYMVMMDHDDIALPDRLEQSVGFLDAHPEIDGCSGVHAIFSPMPWVRAWRTGAALRGARYLEPETVGAYTLFGGVFYNPTACFRRELLHRVAVWHDPSLKTGSDDDFFERLIAGGARFAVLPRVAILYRRRRNSNSRRYAGLSARIRTGIARRAVGRLVPEATREELALHDRLVLRDALPGEEDEAAVRAWFGKLLRYGTPRWGEGVKQVLGLNWQRYCAVRAGEDFFAALRAVRDFPELAGYTGSLGVFLYQAQKRMVRNLFT